MERDTLPLIANISSLLKSFSDWRVIRQLFSVDSGRLSITPSITTGTSEQWRAISLGECTGRRNGLSERFAAQNKSIEIESKKGSRLLMNPAQRVNRSNGSIMQEGAKRNVNRPVVSPAITEIRGAKNGLSIK
jgi:hypothetical protein